MDLGQAVTELKQHLEHGAEVLASHIPVLVEWATKAESDPLVQAALSVVLSPGGKQMVVDLIGRLASLEQDAETAKQQAASEAAAAAVAAATAPPADPAEADPSAASAA